MLDACGIAAIVDLDGGQGEPLRSEIERWAPLGGRVAVFELLAVGERSAASLPRPRHTLLQEGLRMAAALGAGIIGTDRFYGHVLSRDKLLNEVWGYNYFGTTRTLDQHVAQLRKKIEASPDALSPITTVHGVGYRFDK